jgi:hypothetical protein
MTSRGSESLFKYGVAGAGAVGKSFIGRLPGKATDIGPVVGVSYSVATRTANALRAGHAARDAAEMNHARTVLFHAPPDQASSLLRVLDAAAIDWIGKALIVCDCEVEAAALAPFMAKGASLASAREFGIPGYLAVRGAQPAADRLARELRLRAVDIPPAAENAFAAALTLASTALTPLIDRVAALLRESGVREPDAPRFAATLFQSTANNYAHSGKQSWGWYTRGPEAAELEAQIRGAGPQLGRLLRELALLGFDVFDKHGEVAKELRKTRARH